MAIIECHFRTKVAENARRTVRRGVHQVHSGNGASLFLIEVNDLIDHNVAGALSSNYRFYSGLRDAGGKKMSEGQILDEVWQQEEDIRKETIVWMDAFLYMAYGPLTDAELQGYIDFSETAAGQALNRALFVGFDSLYDLIYYEIGQAVAAELQATDL